MKTRSGLYILALLALVITSCKEKTEREKYEEVRSSLKYKAYRTVSETMIVDSLDLNKSVRSVHDLPMPVTAGVGYKDDTYIRLMLGYNWTLTKKDAFAFAESDIVLDKAKNPEEKYLAHSLNAIMMYENGWKQLAEEESKLAKEIVAKNPNNTMVVQQVVIFHLLMGTLCIKEKSYEAASFHFLGFGQVTGIMWPYKLIDAYADIEKGDVQKGLQKLKRMSEDPEVPEEIRVELLKLISDVEKNAGSDVDSKLFWPSLISKVLMEQMKRSSVKEVKEMGGAVQVLIEKTGI